MMLPSTSRCRLLRADQQDSQGSAAGGDVHQDVFDWRAAGPGRVLVQFIQDYEPKRLTAAALLLLEYPAEQSADDEPLRGVMEGVNVDYGDGLL